MTLYKTDFSEYASSAQPSDWTERWNAGLASITVIDLAEGMGGKSSNLIHGSTANKYMASWDDPGSSVTDFEILVRMKGTILESESYSTDGIRVAGRCNGSGSGYFCNLNRHTSGTIRLVIFKYLSFSYSGATSVNVSLTSADWYWIRFRISGTDFYAKVWEDSLQEPADWTLTWSDASLAGGYVGLGSNHATDSYCDWFAIETSNGSWPIPAPYQIDDFSLDLTVQANAFDYLKMLLSVVEGSFLDFFTMNLSVAVSVIDSLKMLLQVGTAKLEDFKMFLEVTDGTVLDNFAMLLDVVDGTVFDNFKMELAVVSATPAFRSVIAQRVSSIVHEA